MSKLRLLFVKEGPAAYISHLDLLRTVQRAFPRTELEIKHSQGFHPHPIISIVLPLPVAQSSDCELLDFEVTQDTDGSGIAEKLNEGLPEGLRVLGRILPALVVLLSAVQMFRASGAMELLTGLLSPVLEGLGIPPETAVLLLVRPVSGSGALAVGSQLMEQYGPDSYIGRVTAVMLGCSETTFYTVAVYYGAAGIRRTRHTIPAALAADAAAFIAAAWAVRVFLP